jgi:RNA polymerase-binding transcription factor DksA
MAKNTQKSSSGGTKGSKAAPSKSASAAKKTAPAATSKTVTKAQAKQEASETKTTKAAAAKQPATTKKAASKAPAPTKSAPEPQTAPAAAPKPASPVAATARKVPMVGASPKKLPKDIFSASTGTPTTDPFPAKELEKFRTLIQDIRVENVEELEALTEQLREMTSSDNMDDNSAYSLHMAEQGTDAMEREKTFLQAQRTSDYIKKLDESLRRIQDGTFGLCRVCGLRLDSKRLMAVPVTQVCTYYKNTSKPCEPGRLHMEAMGITEDDV